MIIKLKLNNGIACFPTLGMESPRKGVSWLMNFSAFYSTAYTPPRYPDTSGIKETKDKRSTIYNQQQQQLVVSKNLKKDILSLKPIIALENFAL
jgi:hypothetical protein